MTKYYTVIGDYGHHDCEHHHRTIEAAKKCVRKKYNGRAQAGPNTMSVGHVVGIHENGGKYNPYQDED